MNPFKGRHFQRDIILWAVRWYCKYGISYRELQEMLAERGVNVDHSTIYRWVQRYAPEMEKRLRWYWRNPSDLCPWHMDETYVKVNGRWAYLYRAVDSRGRHCCKVSDEAAFCLIQRPYISKTLLTRRISPRGS
ncbi:IS6 family transposase, partial [Klebsiella pneumoniae]|uniref:IS6 family transposase n=1 Tax=Klebsiella pneumoniae TaxID=573 RepID=UPI001E4776C3